ncbi:MAG TPA: hypothetical protein VIY73_22085 [Polyangiaceae bacterium]
MRRRIVIALLATGTFLGYGSAIAHAVHAHRTHGAACSGWHHDGDRGDHAGPDHPGADDVH